MPGVRGAGSAGSASTAHGASTARAQVLLTGPGSVARERSDAADLAAALTHAVSRQLCRADTVDLAQLVVEAHRQCWRVALDIHVLNDDGCLLDACMFAAVAALSVLQVLAQHDRAAPNSPGTSLAACLLGRPLASMSRSTS